MKMDAFEIYGRFISNGTTPARGTLNTEDNDAIYLADIMSGKIDMKTVDNMKTADTVINTPGTKSVSYNSSDKQHWKFVVDTDIAERSRPRIQSFLNSIGELVSINWVRSFASRIYPRPEDEIIAAYETLNEESDRHTHFVKNSVIKLLDLIHNVDYETCTSFAFSHNSKKAIHIQRLAKKMSDIFPGIEPVISLIIIGSVGLPLHELFKPREFMQMFTAGRFKHLNADSIIKITLRDKFEIDKITPRLEANQLLQKYEEQQDIFKVNIVGITEPQTFMLKRFYSYPSAFDLSTIIVRAEQNRDRWFGD